MKKMTEAQAIEHIREHAESLDYSAPECFAVRGDYVIPRKRFRRSYNRPDGVQTSRLQGVCACYVAQNDMFGDYLAVDRLPNTSPYGPHKFLLRGVLLDHGNDTGEVILGDHTVVAMIID